MMKAMELKTMTKTKCSKDPSHAIFLKSREFKDIRYDAYNDKYNDQDKDDDKDKDKDRYKDRDRYKDKDKHKHKRCNMQASSPERTSTR